MINETQNIKSHKISIYKLLHQDQWLCALEIEEIFQKKTLNSDFLH